MILFFFGLFLICIVLIGYGFVGKIFYVLLICVVLVLCLEYVVFCDFGWVYVDLFEVWVSVDLDEVIEVVDIDLVVIVLFNVIYVSFVEWVLCVGKYVVVDKLFIVILVEVWCFVDFVCEWFGQVFLVFQNWCFDSDFFVVEVVLQVGSIGLVCYFELVIECFCLQVCDCWCEYDLFGFGLWFDFGLYLFDQVLCLFGVLQCVYGYLCWLCEGVQIDDWFEVLFDYLYCQVVLCVSMFVVNLVLCFNVYGDYGSLFKVGVDIQEV